MAGLLDQMGIDKKEFEQIATEKVGTLLDSKVYDVAVDAAFIRKTDSGAKMLELSFKLEDGRAFKWSTCTQSGDEKGNKATYTDKNTGKERDLPGIISLRHFLDAIEVQNPDASVGQVKFGDNTIEALCMTNVQGKKLKLGINQFEDDYDGGIVLKNDIKNFMTIAGNNGKGEPLEEKVIASLTRNPIKRLKKTAAQAAPQDTGDVKAAGWE